MKHILQSTLALTMVLATASAAMADVIVVSNVTAVDPTAGGSPAPVTHVIKAYYQDDKARVDSDTGAIVLYDFKLKTVYRLNPSAKTYSVVPIGELPPEDDGRALQASRSTKPRVDSDIKVKARTDHKTVAGLDATELDFDATLKAEGSRPSGGGFNGGFGGGFGRHGGGGHNGGQRRQPAPLTLSGQYWMSSTVVLTDKATEMTLLPLLSETMLETRTTCAALQDIAHKLDQQHKGVPVASRVEMKGRASDGEEVDRVVTMEVVSVTPHGLDRGMFYPPADYTQSYPVQVQTAPGK